MYAIMFSRAPFPLTTMSCIMELGYTDVLAGNSLSQPGISAAEVNSLLRKLTKEFNKAQSKCAFFIGSDIESAIENLGMSPVPTWVELWVQMDDVFRKVGHL